MLVLCSHSDMFKFGSINKHLWRMRLIYFILQSALKKAIIEKNYDNHTKLKFCGICVLF